MAKSSAGLLLYRIRGDAVEVLLVHMGGPFWSRRDAGAWSIPKGEYEQPEDPFAAARREFTEETGLQPPAGEPLDLGVLKQPGGKLVRVWAIEGDLDVSEIESDRFEMEWPRGSGTLRSFPEVDRAAWCELPRARERLVKGQLGFLDALARALGAGMGAGPG